MNWTTLLLLFLSASLATTYWITFQGDKQSDETNAEFAKESGRNNFMKRIVGDANGMHPAMGPAEGIFSFNF